MESAQKQADRPAVFWGDDQYRYDELLGQSSAVAHKLMHDLGVSKGDRVALWMHNRPEFVSALNGIFRAGAVAVPINNFLKPDEVTYILNDAEVDVIITDRQFEEALKSLRQQRPALKHWFIEELTRDASAEITDVDSASEDLAVVIYTSGTTGRPKGAMLTHGNLIENVNSCQTILKAVDADRFVLLLPMFHSFMLTVCNLLPLHVGGSIVLIKSLHPPKNVMLEIAKHQATILPAIPPLFRAMLHDSVPTQLPLRVCISGSAPLPVETLNAFNSKFPFPLIEGYGLSEASPVVSFNPLEGPWIAGSIGKPVTNVEVSVRAEDGSELPIGEIGEICVRGANVMKGYLNRPEETSETIRDGWLYTGDVGYENAEGYFFITDRKKDMLLVNGINVYPREIEEVIYQFPGIKEAAVVGVTDSRRGEMPVAFIVPMEPENFDMKALQEFIKSKLADYKVPRRYEMIESLPRNSTQKILKTELRQRFAEKG